MKTNKPKKIITEEHVEAKQMTVAGGLTSIFKGATESLWKDVLQESGKTITEQVLVAGEATNIKKKKEEPKHEAKADKPKVTEAFMEYKREIINAENTGDRQAEMQRKRTVDEIRMEIQKLMKTSQVVERVVKDANAGQAPVKPGKYHITFFEFVLTVIKDATRKLEDTVSYGAVFTSKKQQSKYWSSFQKHGTSFGLSGERTVATQTG